MRFTLKRILMLTWFVLMSSLIFSFLATLKGKSSKKTTLKKVQQPKCKNPYDKSQVTNRVTVNPTTFSRKAEHFPESLLRVDTTNDEKKCPELYKIARAMLDGEKIKLPHETNNTRWKFRERLDLDVLAKTNLHWNHPWHQGESSETLRKLKRYNVSATSIKGKRKYLLTYGHNCCAMSKKRAINQAIDVGKVDYAEATDLSYLSVAFQIAHQNLLRHRKGAGYWLWKPYIILKTLLTKMNDGDLLIFHDAGAFFIKDTGPLYKICTELENNLNVLTFHQPYEESRYSKRDAFTLIGMDDPRVYQEKQTQRMSGLQVYMKSCTTLQFAMEHLAYASDRRIVSDDKNVMGKPNFKDFVGNRHDQTVFSLLSKKWGILELRDPCTCGRNKFTQDGKYASGPYHSLYVNDRVRE